jgi:hypothetical protein
MYMDPLSDHVLDRIFDEIMKEHARLLTSLKGTSDLKAERAIQKEVALLQVLANQIIKLRNFRREAAERRARE